MSALTLRQRQAIDRCKELLVPAAEKLLETANVKELDKNDFGERQLRQLIAIAKETESPAVVLNFILFQIGRDKQSTGWGYSANGEKLGMRMIGALKSGVVQEALDKIPDLDAETTQLARIELVRHFLGFASRYLKYLELERPDPKSKGTKS